MQVCQVPKLPLKHGLETFAATAKPRTTVLAAVACGLLGLAEPTENSFWVRHEGHGEPRQKQQVYSKKTARARLNTKAR